MELFDLFVKLGVDDTDFVKKISDIGNKVSTFSTSIVSGMSVAVTAVKNVGTAIVDNVSQLAAYGDGIDKASQKMGISIEAYQEWDAVMQHSGTSISALSKGMITLSKQAESNSDAFEQLGISQEEIASMNQEELFGRTIEALQGMEEGTDRTVLAQKLLGGSVKELGALLNTSAEDTQAMKDRVHELGGVMSTDAVKSSALFQDNLQDMQTAISGIGRGLTEEFLPSLNLLMAGFTSLIINEEGAEEKLTEGFNEFVDGIGTITNKLQPIMEQLIPRLVDFAVESLPLLGELALTIINTLASAVFQNLNRLVEVGINLIKNLIKGITDNLPLVISAALSIISQLGETLTSNIGDIIEMGLELIKGIISGIVNNLPLLVETAAEIVANLVDDVIDHLPEILDLALDIILTLVDGLTGDNLSKIASAAVTLVVKIIETLTDNLPEFYEKGYEILGKLISGLVEQAPTIIGTAINTIADLISQLAFNFDWTQIGKDILSGIINGLKSGVTAIEDAINDVGNSIADGFKNFFQISSPSKLMRDKIGKFLPLGIIDGIKSESEKVSDAIHSLTDDVSKNPVKIDTDIKMPNFEDISKAFSSMGNLGKMLSGFEVKTDTDKKIQSFFDDVISQNTINDIKKANSLTNLSLSKNIKVKDTNKSTNGNEITININGIQFQDIEELTTAISETMERQTRRAAASYGI